MRDQHPEPGGAGDDQGHDQVESLLRELGAPASVEATAEQTVRTILGTLPGYDDVSVDALRRSVRRNFAMTIRVLHGGEVPSADDLPEAEALALERLEAGVPLGSLLPGFRLCMTSILNRLLKLAPDYGVSAETALGFSTTLWSLGDAFSSRAMQVYQERAVAQAVSDSARRIQWTIDALTRGLPAAELRIGASEFGVPDTQELRAFRLTVPEGTELEAPETGLLPGGYRVVTSAPSAGGVLGIAAAAPGGLTSASAQAAPSARTDQRLALGPAVGLGGLRSSYAAALEVHEAAVAVGWSGYVDLQRLSWRMAVTARPETTRMLRQRWVEPLEGEREFAEHLLEAVSAYLSHGLNIPRAAASIPVHANTLRYRLRRFADLTGGDLESIDSVVELAWVLADRLGEPSL